MFPLVEFPELVRHFVFIRDLSWLKMEASSAVRPTPAPTAALAE